MAKTITLKFEGQCKECGARLAAGTRARWYGKGKVYCANGHAGSTDGEPAPGQTWKQKYGRCEDAPCCGCCGGFDDYQPYNDYSDY